VELQELVEVAVELQELVEVAVELQELVEVALAVGCHGLLLNVRVSATLVGILRTPSWPTVGWRPSAAARFTGWRYILVLVDA